MEKKGRPATKPPTLKEGYYLDVRSKGSSSGVKIRRDTKADMEFAIRQYERSKTPEFHHLRRKASRESRTTCD